MQALTTEDAGQAPRRFPALEDYPPLAAAACVVGAVAFALFGRPFMSSFLALVLLALCIYPAARYASDRRHDVPAIPILAGAYAVQFAVPVFFSGGALWLVDGLYTLDPASINVALAIAIVAFVGFLGACYAGPVNRLVERLPPVHLHLDRTRALAYVVVFSVLVLGASRLFYSLEYDDQVRYAGVFRVLSNQLLIAIGVLAWLAYTSGSLAMRLAYYALVAIAVVDGMSTGFLEAALAPVGILFASQWIYYGRLNKPLIAVLVATMLLLNPVKAEFRELTWYSPSGNPSNLEKAELWIESGLDFWADAIAGGGRADDAALQLVRRTSMIDVLAHVYEETPANVPYYKGETYKYFAYSLVPRLLWPGKPIASANRTLAVDYELTTEEGAERSTFGISLIGEGYANFGWIGSTLIMVVMGLVLLVLLRLFGNRRSGPGGYALFFAFFIYFLNGLGTSAEILLGNILQGMLASYVLIWWAIDGRASCVSST